MASCVSLILHIPNMGHLQIPLLNLHCAIFNKNSRNFMHIVREAGSLIFFAVLFILSYV